MVSSGLKNKAKIAKLHITYSIWGPKISPLYLLHVKNFHCSQCSPQPTGWDSWIQASGLHKQMERISAH